MRYSDGRYIIRRNTDKICSVVRYVAKKKSRAKDDFRVLGLSKSSNEVSVTETREMVTKIVLRRHCTGSTDV